MWYIMSRSGLRGIEPYTSEAQAWQAADLRNALVNQGWHPIKVEVAQSTSFSAGARTDVPSVRAPYSRNTIPYRKLTCKMFVKNKLSPIPKQSHSRLRLRGWNFTTVDVWNGA